MKKKIMKFREARKSKKLRNLVVIKRSNKVVQALQLPKVLNLNPRSIYNKKKEFVTFVKEEEVDLICLSESWEKEHLTLDKVIKMDDYEIISNVFQRKGKGGRPAIIVNKMKFYVENLTQTEVEIPWGVEAVWAVLTPKNATSASKVQKIIVCSMYSKPDSRKKSVLLDHIAEVYNSLSSKYRNGLHWMLCGDTNDLKLDEILNLNSNLKQLVQSPTRLNPPRLLDPIITTLGSYYQLPECLPPLDADPHTNGKPSDHLMVLMSPVSVINNRPARTKTTITYRPFNEMRLQQMQKWIEDENWYKISQESSADKKMEMLHNLILSKYHEFFPEKSRIVASDDEPFFTEKLEKMKRRKCRIYRKQRKSKRWYQLEKEYLKELEKAKQMFYINKIKNLRKKNPRLWHQQLKKLTRFDQHQDDVINVESIKDLTDAEQAEEIADKFAEISQEYDVLENGDVKVPNFSESDYPIVQEDEVRNILEEMDTNKANVTGDIPAKVINTSQSIWLCLLLV